MNSRRIQLNPMTMRKHAVTPSTGITKISAIPAHHASPTYARTRVMNAAMHHRAPLAATRVRIGIVSHPQYCDPSRWASIRKQIKNALEQHATCGAEAVTLLAGATDRLFATVARELEMRLSLVIASKDFQSLFNTPDALSEFIYLRAIAHSKTQLDHPTFNRQAFDDASKFVVDTCDLLIAVGSGQSTIPNPGTGNIIRYAGERGKLLVWIDPDAPLLRPGLSPIR